MEQKEIRLLRANEIECRVGTISEKGLSLLLYKDARVDMKLLDEVYGPLNWKRQHEMIGGDLYCTVSETSGIPESDKNDRQRPVLYGIRLGREQEGVDWQVGCWHRKLYGADKGKGF